MISTAIKAKREAKGWSKKYLADLIGVSSAAIGQYEKGDNKPKIEVLLKLSKVFEYDFINDKALNKSEKNSVQLSQKGNNLIEEADALNSNQAGFKDVHGVNHNLSYDENSTFPNGRIEEPQTIPMYNVPASASMLEMYADLNDVKVVGHLSIPGAVKGSFALPVHGHSMYPTLANGSWGIVRPISDRQDIEWGNIYYIEYGDYRVWKRLIKDDNSPDSVILYSDNDKELVGGKPKYAAKTIKAERISRLCLLTDILIKPNY